MPVPSTWQCPSGLVCGEVSEAVLRILYRKALMAWQAAEGGAKRKWEAAVGVHARHLLPLPKFNYMIDMEYKLVS